MLKYFSTTYPMLGSQKSQSSLLFAWYVNSEFRHREGKKEKQDVGTIEEKWEEKRVEEIRVNGIKENSEEEQEGTREEKRGSIRMMERRVEGKEEKEVPERDGRMKGPIPQME